MLQNNSSKKYNFYECFLYKQKAIDQRWTLNLELLVKLFGLLSKLLASLMRNYFPKRPSGAPLHTLSKLYDVPVGFVTPPPILRLYIAYFAVAEGWLGKARLSGFIVRPCFTCGIRCQKLWFHSKFRHVCRRCAFGCVSRVDFSR